AESVTVRAVALAPLQTPTRTSMRFPTVRLDAGVTDRVVPNACALACCTNDGDAPGDVGVTAFDGEEAGPAPIGLLAVTVKVYCVPPVNPLTVAPVGGGVPLTVVGVCGVLPIYGVIVYCVAGPPEVGAFQVTNTVPLPAVALTPVTWPGAGDGANTTSTQ